MKFSPIVDAKPEYSSLLGRVGPDFTSTNYRLETMRLDLEVAGRRIFESREIDVFDVQSRILEVTLPVPKLGMRRKWHDKYLRPKFGFTYTKWVRGKPYSVRMKVKTNLVLPPSGPSKAKIASPTTQYPSMIQNGRARVEEKIKSPFTRPPSVPHSSPVRAATEQSFRPFRRTDERVTSGVYGLSSDTIVPILSYERTWSGTRTPNFGKLKKSQLPVNPHSVGIRRIDANYSVSSNRNKADGDYRVLIVPFTERYAASGLPSHNANARNKAIKKLIERMQVGIDANLAQDMAQLGQTIDLISHNVKKITQSVRYLKKGNISKATDSLLSGRSQRTRIPKGKPNRGKSVAENWLELQYGWKPLLQDIEGTLKAISNYVSAGGFVQRATGSAQSTSMYDFTWDFTRNSTGLSEPIRCISNETTKCKIVVRYRLSDPFKAFFAQTGFTNPINLGWEILPFSFVVDWFLPIGPYLEALTAFDGLTFLDGSQVQFTRAITAMSANASRTSSINPTSTAFEYTKYQAESIRLDRIKLTTFPSLTFPSLKNGFSSVDHCTNALALMRAAFRG